MYSVIHTSLSHIIAGKYQFVGYSASASNKNIQYISHVSPIYVTVVR